MSHPSLLLAIAAVGRAHVSPGTSVSPSISFLLDRIANSPLSDLLVTNAYGVMPLHCSIYFSLPAVTSAILHRLATLSTPDSLPLSAHLQPTPMCPSPLMLAALLGAHEVLRSLHALLPGRDVAKLINQPFPLNGWTALHFASVAERQRIATVCALGEEPGADFAARSWNGTPVFPVQLTMSGLQAGSPSESLNATLISSIASRAGWALAKVGQDGGVEEVTVNAVVGK